MLLVKEMRASYFGDAIGEGDLLQAVTPVSANVEKDYERLELLGELPVSYNPWSVLT